MAVSVVGSKADDNEPQKRKALMPMLPTAVDERSIDVRAVSRKAAGPMAVSVVGINTDESELHA